VYGENSSAKWLIATSLILGLGVPGLVYTVALFKSFFPAAQPGTTPLTSGSDAYDRSSFPANTRSAAGSASRAQALAAASSY
jgi:hypothetical protein